MDDAVVVCYHVTHACTAAISAFSLECSTACVIEHC